VAGVKAVLFDFGGTLDADGVAWKERFHACYRDACVDLDAEGFARRFYDADDPLVGTIPETAGLDDTVERLVANLEAGLGGDRARGRRVAARFLAESRATLARNAGVLARLAERYELGIVSNFYGNLDAVCRDAGISRYLTVVVDSTKVGAEKPSPEIFHAALAGLSARAEDCIFVGDSLRRDRTGARNMGMQFVWVAAADAARPDEAAPGDRAVPSVAALEGMLT
jgi:putative hydrolase of the HAD superfamily